MAEPIAIVSWGARLPGCSTGDDLWRLLLAKEASFTTVPAGRWPVTPTSCLAPQVGAVDHVYVTRGAFLTQDQLENNENTLESDPLVRLTLVTGGEAWHGALTPHGLAERTGVILGNLFLPTEQHSNWGRSPAARSRQVPLNLHDSAHSPASRLAANLGLRGPAYTLDAACASSLYAIQLAMTELRTRRVDAMLAGGVSRPDCFYTQMGFCQLRALSPNGVPRPMDPRADGMLVGEGAVIFLLRRLADAERDGNQIHGILRAVGLANDRHGNLLAPACEGQLRAMRAAYQEAGWQPGDVDYIECHATGTPIGDRVELESLATLLADSARSVGLGSVKANLGHLLTAAGATGVLKVLLALRHGIWPPQPNHETVAVPTDRFHVPHQAEIWHRPLARARRAAVSGFGFGGINAHLLIEEGTAAPVDQERVPTRQSTQVKQVEFLRRGQWNSQQPPAGIAIPPIVWREMLPCQQAMLALAQRFRSCVSSGSEPWKSAGVIVDMELPVEPFFYSRRWVAPKEKRAEAGPPLTADRTLGSLGSIVASRVARLLGSGGPAFVVSTGQASFTALLHIAESASAGGTNEFFLGWLLEGRTAQGWKDTWQSELGQKEALSEDTVAVLVHCVIHGEASERSATSRPVLTREQCLEFAIGSASRALGPLFTELDSWPTRVRLPDAPLMLVHRVTEIEAEPLALKPGRLVTEHEVAADAWYLDGGRMPTSIAVESGQADLLLVGYLGIDQRTRGEAVYRLLDAQIVFHRGLPCPGETIRYDIRITRFQEYGGIWLFFFEFDATIGGQPLLTMRNGCAGFFTPAALAAGQGLVLGKDTRATTHAQGWIDTPMSLDPQPLSSDQVNALRSGDLDQAFGGAFAGKSLPPSLRLPSDRLALVEDVVAWQIHGGRHGHGFVRSRLPIQPDDWHLICHFKDDPVMPGTLMFECCLQTLRIWMLRAGFIAAEATAAEPVPGVTSKLKCRGQVIPTTRWAEFEIHPKETGYGPDAFVIADAILYADGKPIVFVENLSLRLSGVTREGVLAFWELSSPADRSSRNDRRAILEYALGSPSRAFGPPYRPFDRERVLARLPSPPYLFVDHVEASNCPHLQPMEGAVAEAAYDIPTKAWYLAAAGADVVPFAVLLEIALQPCGWLAAYMGSALLSQEQLCFRNLGGEAKLHQPLRPGAGKVLTQVRVSKLARSMDMFIQHYQFRVQQGSELAYEGATYFGFFTGTALAQQEGLRGVARRELSHSSEARMPLACLVPGINQQWSMLDTVTGDGADPLLTGYGQVPPERWFFAAHFYQDPVWPGSLGIEGFLQAARAWLSLRWPDTRRRSYLLPQCGTRHEWTYRGQILRSNRQVCIDVAASTTGSAGTAATFSGCLFADGLPIYQMKNFVLGFDS